MVECFLAKEDVAGSTPVSRSKALPTGARCKVAGLFQRQSLFFRGAVPKW